MRIYRFVHGFYGAIVLAVSAIGAFFNASLQIDYGNTWRFMRDLGIMAFRKIADLKPVCRESYNTHGLSLADRWRFC